MIAIAIDGPAGAGKSTIARLTAKKLGFLYVDTGALYRTVGYAARQRGIDPAKGEEVAQMLPDITVDLDFDEQGVQRTLLNGRDVSSQIRTPEMSRYASLVSAHKEVRDYLLWLQRKLAKEHNVIMDGRDIGTTVLPDADLKIYLTATPEDRARRRFDEYLSQGVSVDYEKLLNDIKQRDYDDSHREISPLRRAEDAKLVDTSGNTLEESLELMEAMIRRHLGI